MPNTTGQSGQWPPTPCFASCTLRTFCSVLALSLAGFACGEAPDASVDADRDATLVPESALAGSQLAFWRSLESLCGQAFEGRVVESEPPDASFDGRTILMHVRQCQADEIRIPFFVGEDRSRTWVVTQTDMGLRLKHDHRHEDGSEDEVTQYGGDTRHGGLSESQDFHADEFTGQLVPTAARNVWTIEVSPGRTFAYALRREGSDRRFRVEFDLNHPVETPPAPWGG